MDGVYVVVNSCKYDMGLVVIPYSWYNPDSDMIFYKGSESECEKWLSER